MELYVGIMVKVHRELKRRFTKGMGFGGSEGTGFGCLNNLEQDASGEKIKQGDRRREGEAFRFFSFR